MTTTAALQAWAAEVAAREAAIDAAMAALAGRIAALEAGEPSTPPVDPPPPPDPEDPPVIVDPQPDPDPEDPPDIIDPPPVITDPPPPPPQTGTLLHDIAATLEPGEWRRVETRIPSSSFKGFQVVSIPDVGGADGMGWTERLVEYEGTLMMPLCRDSFYWALAVMDSSGQWRRIEKPEGWMPKTEGRNFYERRPFNRWFRDDTYAYFSPADAKTAMGYFVRTPLANPGVFEYFGVSINDSAMDTVGNFSTCYAKEWGRFFAYTPGGRVRSWAPGETGWRNHYSNIPKVELNSGYAGTIIWNPVKQEIIALGGQYFGANPDVGHRVMRITAPDGMGTMGDATMPDGTVFKGLRAAQDRFIVHPVTGEYLLLYQTGIMYRSLDGLRWSVYEDLNAIKPWGEYEQYCPWTHLSGTEDVLVMVSHIEGVWLHRLKDKIAAEPPPIIVPPPPPPPDPNEPPPVIVQPPPPPPAPPPPVGTNAGILARTIAEMAPGEVKMVLPDTSHFIVTLTTGEKHTITDWNPRMHWHAATQQLVLFGHRIAHRVVAFSDAAGYWRDIPLWPDYAEGGFGHWYGWSADDVRGGIYAKTRRLDVASETWTTIPDAAPTNGSNGTMYAWQANVGRLARYGGDIQRWQEYDPATNTWKTSKDWGGHGQHALLEYSDVDGCSLLLGGNYTFNKATLVKPGYTEAIPLPDCPGDPRMKGGAWILPHPDGGWLARTVFERTSNIWGIRPGEGWRDLGPFPLLGLGYQSAAIDQARRVVMIASTTGLHAWKLPEE